MPKKSVGKRVKDQRPMTKGATKSRKASNLATAKARDLVHKKFGNKGRVPSSIDWPYADFDDPIPSKRRNKKK